MNKKKVMCSVLACAMSLSVASTAFAKEGTFTDVSESHWAYSYISNMSSRKIIDGYDDGTFLPDKTVTRAEFSKMLSGAASLSPYAPSFSDVSEDAWYAYYVGAVSEYLVPVGDLFMPENEAKRKDIAAAVVRAKYYDTAVADTTAIEAKFSDIASLSDEEKKYIALAVEHGIMDGFDEGVFKPEEGITRAQAAAILDRAFGNDDLTAIKVNDVSVNINDIERFAMSYIDEGEEIDDAAMQYLKQSITPSIESILICGEIGKAIGLELSEKQINEIEAFKAEATYPGGPSIAFVDTLYTAMEYQVLLLNKYANELLSAGNYDELIKEYYQNNYMCAKHILVEDEALAKELLKKFQKGTDFDSLKKKYSQDPGSQGSPDGYVFTYGEMVPEFEECVKSTDIGELGLCKSVYGWHIILRLDLPEDYTDIQYNIEQSFFASYVDNKTNEQASEYGIISKINWDLVNAEG